MLRCPHCNESALSLWTLSNSGFFRPARCSACGALSRLGVAPSIVSSLIGQVFVLAGMVVSFMHWSWWPLAASFLASIAIHAAISAWSTPVAVDQPRSMPRWLKISLWLLFSYVAISVISLSMGLLRWPN